MKHGRAVNDKLMWMEAVVTHFKVDLFAVSSWKNRAKLSKREKGTQQPAIRPYPVSNNPIHSYTIFILRSVSILYLHLRFCLPNDVTPPVFCRNSVCMKTRRTATDDSSLVWSGFQEWNVNTDSTALSLVLPLYAWHSRPFVCFLFHSSYTQ